MAELELASKVFEFAKFVFEFAKFVFEFVKFEFVTVSLCWRRVAANTTIGIVLVDEFNAVTEAGGESSKDLQDFFVLTKIRNTTFYIKKISLSHKLFR